MGLCGDIWTIFLRDWIVLKRRLVKFILSRMVAPILYLVAFGWGLGRSIQVDSGTYLEFLVPGILALNSMNISFMSVITVHTERIYHKSLEEYIIAPIHPYALVIGKVLAAVLRALLASSVIIVLAVLFGAHFSFSPSLLAVLILNCIVFAEIGFLAAMKIDTYEEMGQVNTYILLPMSFLCGTFFSPHTLPPVLQGFISFLPLTHTSLLLRSISQGNGGEVGSVFVLALYIFIGFILNVKAYRQLSK